MSKRLIIKRKRGKCLGVGKSCLIEINYTMLTLKTPPINTGATEAEGVGKSISTKCVLLCDCENHHHLLSGIGICTEAVDQILRRKCPLKLWLSIGVRHVHPGFFSQPQRTGPVYAELWDRFLNLHGFCHI